MATPNRRDTVWPGSLNGASLGTRRSLTDDEASSRLSASQILSIPDFRSNKKRANPPALLPVKVNPKSQQFDRKRFPRRCIKGNPWEPYFPVLKEEQAGEVTIFYKKTPHHPIVAIKPLAYNGGESVD